MGSRQSGSALRSVALSPSFVSERVRGQLAGSLRGFESQPHIQLCGRHSRCCNFLTPPVEVGSALGSLIHSQVLSGSDLLQGSSLVTILTAMASDSADSRVASPSAQPLLHNHITSDFDVLRARDLPRKDFSTVTERSLEDGEASDSDSDASLGFHPTFWGRCMMAIRRRRPSLRRIDYESGRLPAFEKKRRLKDYGWRKRHGAWACLGIVGFVVLFL